jgi:hemerythrin-like domain-containing protein
MPVQIGAEPDSGFDDPLGMLTDCHRRIEQFLRILVQVAERASGRALTGEESAAAQLALEYFRTGGRRHNADEEESLFPRLRAAASEAEFTEITGLESDHRDAGQWHQAVESLYATWIERGTLAAPEREELISTTRRLKSLYEDHIRLEEQAVFPRAAKLLDPKSIAAMGHEFRARRQ